MKEGVDLRSRLASYCAPMYTNAVVKPIHPKATPVILTTDEERDVRMLRRRMRQRRYNGHCRMLCSGSGCAVRTRKIGRRHSRARDVVPYVRYHRRARFLTIKCFRV